MKTTRFLLMLFGLLAMLAAGCSDEFIPLERDNGAVPFQISTTIPHNGQFNMPLSTGVIIYFSEELNPVYASGKVFVEDENGSLVAIRAEIQEQSIVLYPQSLWKPRCTYTVHVEPGIRSVAGREIAEAHTFTFETVVRNPQSKERLSVQRVFPAAEDPCYDFHTFRVFFNEPIDRHSLEYGVSVRMEYAETGELVPGNLFGRSNQIVFDPENDLTPGKTYSLIVTGALKDYNNTGLEEDFRVDFVPRWTGEHVNLALDKCPTATEGNWFCPPQPEDAFFPKSKFLNQDVNSMLANSVLMGPSNILVGSRLWNEFGDAKLSPDRIPLVVRKGQRLYGKGLKGLVGGEITSGVDTGMVSVTVMTDAIGEMLGSEYIHGIPGLPATIRLTMDAVMTTESATSNAILAQPILGATLVGQATVQKIDDVPNYEAMEIELVGFAEIELVNEYVPVTMALRMVPPPTLPEQEFDEEPPRVYTVSPVDMNVKPEDISDLVPTRLAGDEIIVTFNEPIDPNTVRDNIIVQGPAGQVSGRFDIYNPKVAFKPDRPFEPDTTYFIKVLTGVTDLSGNHLNYDETYTMTTMPYQSSAEEPPLLNATVPGRFVGATLPINFFPEVYFSQIIDENTLIYGDTITLYDLTNGGEMVPCTIRSFSIFHQIVPDSWLESGHEYRMIVTENITNIDGVMLDTDKDRTPGGSQLEVVFTATAYSPFVESMFVTYPYADTNVNGFIDENEYEIETNYMDIRSPLIQGRNYIMGYFPITIESLITDQQGKPRQPVTIQPTSSIYATSVALTLLGEYDQDPFGIFDTGRVDIELQYPASTDLYQADDGLVGVDVDTNMLFQVESQLFSMFIVPETSLVVPTSKLRFTEDGRMTVLVEGEGEVEMNIPIIGTMVMPMDVKMTTMTIPSRRGF